MVYITSGWHAGQSATVLSVELNACGTEAKSLLVQLKSGECVRVEASQVRKI